MFNEYEVTNSVSDIDWVTYPGIYEDEEYEDIFYVYVDIDSHVHELCSFDNFEEARIVYNQFNGSSIFDEDFDFYKFLNYADITFDVNKMMTARVCTNSCKYTKINYLTYKYNYSPCHYALLSNLYFKLYKLAYVSTIKKASLLSTWFGKILSVDANVLKHKCPKAVAKVTQKNSRQRDIATALCCILGELFSDYDFE